MKNNILKYILTGLFAILYIAVSYVSVYHAIAFFGLSNQPWLALILACAFEIGQAAVLFYLLISNEKKIMPWILMGVLTLVQVLGNVYSSYMYMIMNFISGWNEGSRAYQTNVVTVSNEYTHVVCRSTNCSNVIVITK